MWLEGPPVSVRYLQLCFLLDGVMAANAWVGGLGDGGPAAVLPAVLSAVLAAGLAAVLPASVDAGMAAV